MKNSEKKLFESFKEITAGYNFLKRDIYTLEKRRGYSMKKRIIATTCASLVLVSGIVVASNIDNIRKHFDRGLGNGIETAIDNGYIAKPEMEFVQIDDIGVKVKIEDFMMDDVNLSTNFIFEFDKSITNKINLEKITDIELSDLIVTDEENRIIYSSLNKEAFEKYCKEHKLDYNYLEFNESYINNGVNAFIIAKEGNYLELMYNMYTSDAFPKSKKLYYSFETITITENKEEKQIKYELEGTWSITVDVPTEMYNRTEEYYKVTSCDNKDFDVYTAKVTDTGFELGVIISNIEKPQFDIKKLKEYNKVFEKLKYGLISKEEALKLIDAHVEWAELSFPITIDDYDIKGQKVESSYIENEKGEKFKCSNNVSRKCKNYFLENNKYDFYDTFEITRYDITDRIKVVLYYYGLPITIELEKTH